MAKTFKDYLLEGGVKGKTFHHNITIPNDSFFYTIEDIKNNDIYKNGDRDREVTMVFYLKIGTEEIMNRSINDLLKDSEVEPSQLEQLAESKTISPKKACSLA